MAGSVLLNLALPSNASQNEERDLIDERKQAIAWMTKIAHPEIGKLKFVLVATGNGMESRIDDDPEKSNSNTIRWRNAEGRSGLGLDQHIQTFEKTSAKTEAYKAVGYEIVIFEIEFSPGLRISKQNRLRRRTAKACGHRSWRKFLGVWKRSCWAGPVHKADLTGQRPNSSAIRN